MSCDLNEVSWPTVVLLVSLMVTAIVCAYLFYRGTRNTLEQR